MSSLVNNGLIYCVSVELSRIFFFFRLCRGGLVCLGGRVKLDKGRGTALSVYVLCAYMHICVMTHMITKPDKLINEFNKFSQS